MAVSQEGLVADDTSGSRGRAAWASERRKISRTSSFRDPQDGTEVAQCQPVVVDTEMRGPRRNSRCRLLDGNCPECSKSQLASDRVIISHFPPFSPRFLPTSLFARWAICALGYSCP
jgi:hypothetical protein